MARILFLCSRPPYPPVDGARLRMYNLAKVLAEEHHVDIIAISQGSDNERPDNMFNLYNVFEENPLKFYARGLRGLASKEPIQSHAYFSYAMNDWILDHIDDYDLLFCTHLATVKYADQVEIPKVIDLVDAVSKSFIGIADDASLFWRLVYRIEANRARRYEQIIAQRFDECFITTKADQNQIGVENITVLPNGVSSSLFNSEIEIPEENTIVFLGDLSTVANRSAVSWFVQDIFPVIKSKIDDVIFKIVGKSPPKEIRKLDERSDIIVTGFVEDPYQYVRESSVSVAPIKAGGGVQNKVLESMALGTPVVTTELGNTGIDATNEKHLLVRDPPKEFAHATIKLLNDRSFAGELGRNGRELVRNEYSWDKTGMKLHKAIMGVLDKGAHSE